MSEDGQILQLPPLCKGNAYPCLVRPVPRCVSAPRGRGIIMKVHQSTAAHTHRAAWAWGLSKNVAISDFVPHQALMVGVGLVAGF